MRNSKKRKRRPEVFCSGKFSSENINLKSVINLEENNKMKTSRQRRRGNSLFLGLIYLITLQVIGSISNFNWLQVAAVAGRAQDVTFEEFESGSSGGGGGGSTMMLAKEEDVSGFSGNVDSMDRAEVGGDKLKNLDALLDTLPMLSIGQKHQARFECELNKEQTSGLSSVKLVWKKLTKTNMNQEEGEDYSSKLTNKRRQQQQQQPNDERNDIKLISLDQKLITPDKRFKVHHRQASNKWTLTIDNVQQADGDAYYLCQATEPVSQPNSWIKNSSCRNISHSNGLSETGSASNCDQQQQQQQQRERVNQPEVRPTTISFIGGARLNVLAPPKIVENETSASLVLANEHEDLVLKCKVSGEPQSQLMWKKEDNKPLDGIEQRFRHETNRKPNHQILSIDSSELVFEPFLRSHSGAYLCIASNGIQPGVSQRINVLAANCRSQSNQTESCDKPASVSLAATTTKPEVATTTADDSTATRKVWRTFGNGLQQQQSTKVSAKHRAADKRRTAAAGRNALNEQQTNVNGVSISGPNQQMESLATSSNGKTSLTTSMNLIFRFIWSFIVAVIIYYHLLL